MARIRSVKPEFFSDRKLARLLSRDARLLYIAMWNQADEHGRLQGDPRFIKGSCLPYDDDISLTDVERLIAEIEAAGRAQRYEHDGDPYIFLPKLAGHQRLEPEKVPSRLPAPPSKPDPDPDKDTGAISSERRADEPAPDADRNALSYVAGGREQVAGSRVTSAKPPGAEVVLMRRDVESLCQQLVSRLVANGCKKPTITDRWRDAARLMLDRDERDPDEAALLIDWCQADSFWRANVQSMPTFREQYDRLRLQAQRGQTSTSQSTADTRALAGLDIAAKLAREGS